MASRMPGGAILPKQFASPSQLLGTMTCFQHLRCRGARPGARSGCLPELPIDNPPDTLRGVRMAKSSASNIGQQRLQAVSAWEGLSGRLSDFIHGKNPSGQKTNHASALPSADCSATLARSDETARAYRSYRHPMRGLSMPTFPAVSRPCVPLEYASCFWWRECRTARAARPRPTVEA